MYSYNYLEIVLTAIGWDFYGKIVFMIYSLNLHLLPIVFVMFQNWRSSVTSSNSRAGYENEMNNNFFDVGIMMLVIIFFWMPNSATKFDAPAYIQNIQSVSNDSSSSTVFTNAQNAMGVPSATAIHIPPGWFIMVNGTKAVINQLKEWMVFTPTTTAILTLFNSLKIEDDEVRAESDQFYSQCYLPALERYQNSTRPVPNLPAGDANYIGNDVFLNTPGLYKACTQSDRDSNICLGDPLTMSFTAAERKGITTRFVKPSVITNSGRALSFSSTPSCHQWWSGGFDQHYAGGSLVNQSSLKEKLYEQAIKSAEGQAALEAVGINTGSPGNPGPSFASNVTNWVGSLFSTNESGSKDALITAMLRTDAPSLVADPDDSYPEPDNWRDRIKGWGQAGVDWVQGVAAGAGAAYYSVILGVVLELLQPALQMIQAAMIFGILLFMAITLPIGGFSAETVIKHGMVLLGVLMLSFIWHVADLLNEGLLRILYPGAMVLTDLVLLGLEALVFQIWLFILYIVLPGIFIFMMKVAGQEVASNFSGAMTDFQNAGKKGATVPKAPKGGGKGKK